MLYRLNISKCNKEETIQQVMNLLSSISSDNVDGFAQELQKTGISIEFEDTNSDYVKKLSDDLSNIGVDSTFEEFESEVMETIESDNDTDPKVTPVEKNNNDNDDDDNIDYPSNPQNLIDSATKREDLFSVDSERGLIGTVILSLIIGLSLGFWFNGMEILEFSPDFFERLPAERTAKLVVDIPKMEEKKEKKTKKTEKKTLEKKKRNKRPSGTGKGGGKGDPRARITRRGVLGIISGKSKGKSVVGRNLLSKGNFAKDIDAILENVGGLKRSGSAGTGRKGLAGVGFGKGYGSGFGGGSGGIDDMLGGLFGGSESIGLKKRGKLVVEAPRTVSSGPMAGGRSQQSIMRVVTQHIAGLRYAYNKRLKVKPGLRGKITVRFSINQAGTVVKCSVVRTTIKDSVLEKQIVSQILRWRFDKTEKKGISVVEYPFAFSK